MTNKKIKIDNKTYSISENNYYKEEYKKKQIILGGSSRREGMHVIRLQNKEFGLTKKWNTYTISKDGIIYQHYDPKYYSDYMDEKDIDRYSISIVLENMGPLIKTPQNIFENLIGEICPGDNIIKKTWNGLIFWDAYTEAQFESTINLCEFLCKKFNILNKTIGFNSFNNDTKYFNGIVCRSNYSDQYLDLNPSFNFLKFKEIIEN